MIRVEGTGLPWWRHVFNLALPAILVARYITFVLFGLYRGVWRYAGARDAASIFLAVVVSEEPRSSSSGRRCRGTASLAEPS